MKINLDTRVVVRLTPQGKLALAYWSLEQNGRLDEHRDLLNSDVQEFPLWKLISVLGKYALFARVQEEFFRDGIEILEESK